MPKHDIKFYPERPGEIDIIYTTALDHIQTLKAYMPEDRAKDFCDTLQKTLEKEPDYQAAVRKLLRDYFIRCNNENKQHFWLYDTFFRTITEGESEEVFPFNVWIPAMVGTGYYIYLNTLEEAKKVAIQDIKEQIETLKESLIEIENMKG